MIHFDHFAISTEDVASSVMYYATRFSNCEILYQDSTWALIQIAGVKVAFVRPTDHPPHLAFRVDSRVELNEEAASAGAQINIHRDRSESFYTRDPSGNALELIYYPEVD